MGNHKKMYPYNINSNNQKLEIIAFKNQNKLPNKRLSIINK